MSTFVGFGWFLHPEFNPQINYENKVLNIKEILLFDSELDVPLESFAGFGGFRW